MCPMIPVPSPDRVSDFLRIPTAYAASLGGLHWSRDGEQISTAKGQTFVLAVELADFLEGIEHNNSEWMHIGQVLHFLALLGRGFPPKTILTPSHAELERLRTVASEVQAQRRFFNAGALFGHLTRGLPPLAEPPELLETVQRLRTPALMVATLSRWPSWAQSTVNAGRSSPGSRQPVLGPDEPTWIPLKGEEPPLSFDGFEAQLAQAVGKLSSEELQGWLRRGFGPAGTMVPVAADRLAGQVDADRPAARMPRSLAAVVAALSVRPRLAGAAPLVPQLVGALSLPARRLDQPDLPLGGYADITTRGRPELLLPTQYALDGLEFLRRFTTNELLYFRRETPPGQIRERLLLVLDQGVRTWGEVRLLLSASLLALLRRAERTGTPVRVATTSAPGLLLDPATADPEELAQRLEATDLSRDPGPALEQALETDIALSSGIPASTVRVAEAGCDASIDRQTNCDIVLLTHTRSLSLPEVAGVAARAVTLGAAGSRGQPGGRNRLFVVACDRSGAVRFDEVRPGGVVPVSAFRVDLSASDPPPPTSAVPATAEPVAEWTGAIEPIPWPFQFGMTGLVRPGHFDFGGPGGDWLLIAGPRGVLLAVRADGKAQEWLPRGWLTFTTKPSSSSPTRPAGEVAGVLTDVVTVLGTATGFAVVARPGRTHRSGAALSHPPLALAHYDLSRRRVTVHRLPEAVATQPQQHARWFYFRELHSVAVRVAPPSTSMSSAVSTVAVDLASGQTWTGMSLAEGVARSRAEQACREAFRRARPPGHLVLHHDAETLDAGAEILSLERQTGRLSLGGPSLSLTESLAASAGDLNGESTSTRGDTTVGPSVRIFTPMSDGKAILRGADLLDARHRCGTLAVVTRPGPSAHGRAPNVLRVFRLPSGRPIREWQDTDTQIPVFTLSADGSRIARLTGIGRLIIDDFDSRAGPVCTPVGRFHHNLEARLGIGRIALMGRYTWCWVLDWETGVLQARYVLRSSVLQEFDRDGVVTSTRSKRVWQSLLMVDQVRFPTPALEVAGGLRVAVDMYGHAVLTDRLGELVCLMTAFRGEWAAALPDGTRCGSSRLLGRSPTVGAAERIGQALRRAEQRDAAGHPSNPGHPGGQA